MDTNKNFEDKLRERLASEELPFDPSAWESFENSYQKEAVQDSPAKGNTTAIFWIVPLLLIFSIVVFQVVKKVDQNLETTQSNSVLSKNKSAPIENGQDSESLGDATSVKSTGASITAKSDESKRSLSLKYSELKKQEQQPSESRGVETIAATQIGDIDDKSNNKYLRYKDETTTVNNLIATIGTKPNLFDTNASTVLSKSPIGKSSERVESEKQAEKSLQSAGNVANSKGARTTMSSSQQSGPEPSVEANPNPASPSNTSQSDHTEKSLVVRNIITTAVIGSLKEGLSPDNRLKNYDSKDLTIPYKYKRNEFFIGLGFNYAQKTHSESIDRAGIDGAEPNVLQIGYERRLSLRWSVGIGLGLTYLNNLDMQVTIKDYHLTSMSFEFVEYRLTHSSSHIMEVPIYLKYNPLGKRYSIFAGAKFNYITQPRINFDRTTNGTTNPIISEIQSSRSYSDYINKYDFALILGGRYRFWKNLELETRISQGLTDISVDSFWGVADTRTSSVSVGINYKFNW